MVQTKQFVDIELHWKEKALCFIHLPWGDFYFLSSRKAGTILHLVYFTTWIHTASWVSNNSCSRGRHKSKDTFKKLKKKNLDEPFEVFPFETEDREGNSNFM